MATEATAILAVFAAATASAPLAAYVALVVAGGWLYPAATVWFPHRREGATPVEHTRAFRGRVVPALFLHHTCHMEHHLYPGGRISATSTRGTASPRSA